MENKVCCCFGHREIFCQTSERLYETVEKLIINNDVKIFMTGGMGKFDSTFITVIKKLKEKYSYIELWLIKPYFSNALNRDKEYYENTYDKILIPESLLGVHPKAAIKKRNRFMVENSDFIILYVYRNFGGAYEAMRYSARLNKNTINLANKNINTLFNT